MGNQGRLRRVEAELTKHLEETTLSFRKLGKKYGVSGQAIFGFCQWRGIKRPKREHNPEKCLVCQDLIKIANKPNSDFISYQTIKEALRIRTRKLTDHIVILRGNGLVSPRFGRVRSKRIELAYQIYFKERLSIRASGLRVGLNNFCRTVATHKTLGWDVPAALLTHDSNDGRNIELKRIKRKGRRWHG